MKKIQAINPKNQVIVNRCVKALLRYEMLNDLRNLAEDSENEREYKKYDRLCEQVFDRYLDYLYSLPKNQQRAITFKGTVSLKTNL
jgi:hypothetical protein